MRNLKRPAQIFAQKVVTQLYSMLYANTRKEVDALPNSVRYPYSPEEYLFKARAVQSINANSPLGIIIYSAEAIEARRLKVYLSTVYQLLGGIREVIEEAFPKLFSEQKLPNSCYTLKNETHPYPKRYYTPRIEEARKQPQYALLQQRLFLKTLLE